MSLRHRLSTRARVELSLAQYSKQILPDYLAMADSLGDEMFVAPTKAALQRFNRGKEVTAHMNNFLQDKSNMEAKMNALRMNFVRKWTNEFRSGIGSNLPGDELKDLANLLLEIEQMKAHVVSQFVQKLYGEQGPITVMQEYKYNSDAMPRLVEVKRDCLAAMERQEKEEKTITKAQTYYHTMREKTNAVKQKVDGSSWNRRSPEFANLLEKWKRMESDTSMAQDMYRNSLERELKTRPNFITTMEEFQRESDIYETVRLDVMQTVLYNYLRTLGDSEDERVCVRDSIQKGIDLLEKYTPEFDVERFNQFFRIQWHFPYLTYHPSDPRAKNTVADTSDDRGNHELDAQLLETLENTSGYDIVEVLNPRSNNTPAKFVQRLELDSDEEDTPPDFPDAMRLSLRHNVTSVSRESDCMPNVVVNEANYRAPKRVTNIDMSDSEKSETSLEKVAISEVVVDDEKLKASKDTEVVPREIKLKVYGIQTYMARTENEISFKEGAKIVMTRTENDKGYAYGYIKKGKIFKKKVYGFFPALLVSASAKKRSRLHIPNPLKMFQKRSSPKDKYN